MTKKAAGLTVLFTMMFFHVNVFAEMPVYPKIESVFQQERSDTQDTVYFRNKDVLRGQVLNTDVVIATQYGMLKVPLRYCAGISFEGARSNTEAIVTVNFNRITGIITDRIITFKIASSGAEIPIRKEKIQYVLLKRVPGETEFLRENEKSDLFLMANGDLLIGEMEERKISIQTDYGKVPVSFAEMKSIQMQGGDNVTAVISKTNGDTMRGTLDTDEMTLKLELGLTIESIYKDKFAKIFVDEARKYAPEQFGTQQPIKGESDGVSSLPTVALPTGDKLSLNLQPELGENGVKMEFVKIPAGEFMMGSNSDETNRSSDEGPVRKVQISKPFYLGIYEVTQAQYEAVMKYNPSRFKGANLPVESITWGDATDFCDKASEITKYKMILPTEAQWEYACRAGSQKAYCFGNGTSQLGEFAWYGSNSGQTTHPVGQKKPNNFGLYDMHGNVWEWCLDWYQSSYNGLSAVDPLNDSYGDKKSRVLRGGSWYYFDSYCRSARRYSNSPDSSFNGSGFRVVVVSGGLDF